MKTTFMNCGKWPAFAQKLRRGKQVAGDRMKGTWHRQIRNPQSAIRNRNAFTLIEMLAVIAVIGVLVALIFPVIGAVKRRQYISHAQAEMAQLETAIERYKATYGFYPPDNQVQNDPAAQRFQVNQLYYELTGTTNINSDPGQSPVYQSLRNPTLPKLTGANVQSIFGVGGFMNCSKPAGGEDVSVARNFLPELRAAQVANNYTNHVSRKEPGVTLLVTSVGGPSSRYAPLNLTDVNPWRYNSSSPTNNPGSYDLWVQLVIAQGQTNLICNWTKQVLVNNPLP